MEPASEWLLWTEVFASTTPEPRRERAMVLDAVGIPHRSVDGGGSYRLEVPAPQAERAVRELQRFAEENRAWPPPREDPGTPPAAIRGAVGAVGYACVLLFFAGLRARYSFTVPAAGATVAEKIRGGEWWRCVTALTLHADLSHLLGNLVFGVLFGVFLAQVLGDGLAWLCFVVSGALGNAANAVFQDAGHTSVGASTGVFGLVGALGAVHFLRRRRQRLPLARRWAPIVVGVVFLGYLGTSGERTDVLAHCCGLASGLLVGLAAARGAERPGAQKWFAVAAVGLIAGSWTLALASR